MSSLSQSISYDTTPGHSKVPYLSTINILPLLIVPQQSKLTLSPILYGLLGKIISNKERKPEIVAEAKKALDKKEVFRNNFKCQTKWNI